MENLGRIKGLDKVLGTVEKDFTLEDKYVNDISRFVVIFSQVILKRLLKV